MPWGVIRDVPSHVEYLTDFDTSGSSPCAHWHAIISSIFFFFTDCVIQYLLIKHSEKAGCISLVHLKKTPFKVEQVLMARYPKDSFRGRCLLQAVKPDFLLYFPKWVISCYNSHTHLHSHRFIVVYSCYMYIEMFLDVHSFV